MISKGQRTRFTKMMELIKYQPWTTRLVSVFSRTSSAVGGEPLLVGLSFNSSYFSNLGLDVTRFRVPPSRIPLKSVNPSIHV